MNDGVCIADLAPADGPPSPEAVELFILVGECDVDAKHVFFVFQGWGVPVLSATNDTDEFSKSAAFTIPISIPVSRLALKGTTTKLPFGPKGYPHQTPNVFSDFDCLCAFKRKIP